MQAHNPYNHQNPVDNPDRFIGREETLSNIEYNLSLSSSKNPQFINMGVTGKEGAGKTSLTNIVELKASKLGIYPVRVNLDSSMVNDDVELFKRIYESLTVKADTKYKKEYLDWIKGGPGEVDFNLHFFQAHFSNQEDRFEDNISEQLVQQDFKNFLEEIDENAIILLLDNAQKLTDNSTLLEKLKHVFAELDGYILFISGTEDTFSEINNAFSPMARVFEKYRVEPFDSYEKTRECLIRPLSEDQVELFTKKTIQEIHRITGGHPYEINLIGFHLFRRYEKNKQDDLELTPEVIEDVVKQLDEWRESINRTISNDIGDLNKLELSLLVFSIECPRLPKDSLIEYGWLEYVNNPKFKSFYEFRRKADEAINNLEEVGALTIQDDTVQLSLDVYSIAYTKYNAYANGIVDNIGAAFKESKVGILPNFHYRAVDELLLDCFDGMHSHFIELGDPQRDLQTVVYDPHGEYNNPSLSDRSIAGGLDDMDYTESMYLHQDDSNEKKYSEDKTYIFRYSFESEEKYSCTTIIHSKEPGKVNDIENRIEEVNQLLGSTSFSFELQTEYDLLADAWEHVFEDDLDKASDQTDEVLSIDENIGHAWNLKSIISAERGEFDDAIQYIDEAINRRQEWVDSHYRKASYLKEVGDVELVAEEFQKMEQILPDNHELFELATCWLSQQMPKESIRYAKKAIKLEDDIHSRLHLVQNLSELEKYEKIIEVTNGKPVDDLGDQMTNFVMTWRLRINALNEVGEPRKALEESDILLEEYEISDKHRSDIFGFRSDSYELIEKPLNAISEIETAIELSEDKDVKLNHIDRKRGLYQSNGMWGSLLTFGRNLLKKDYPQYLVHIDRAFILNKFGYDKGVKNSLQEISDHIEDNDIQLEDQTQELIGELKDKYHTCSSN